MISVKKHIIQNSLLLVFPLTLASSFIFFATPKYYTGNWKHIGAVRTAEGETSAPLDFITVRFAPALLGEMMVSLAHAPTHGSA